jgi:hypothetical protein
VQQAVAKAFGLGARQIARQGERLVGAAACTGPTVDA